MRIVTLLLMLLVPSSGSVVHAKSAPSGYAPFKGWTGTPILETKQPDGIYRMRFLRRYTLSEIEPLLIGSVVFIQAPKSGFAKEERYRSLASLEYLRKSIGITAWKSTKHKDVLVLEAPWEKANRHVRIYLRESEKEVSYSIAMFRRGFADSLSTETELIQQQLAAVTDRKIPWLEKWLSTLQEFGIPRAWAAPDPTCISQCVAASGGLLNAETCRQYCPDTTVPPSTGGTTDPAPPTTTIPPIQVDLSGIASEFTSDPQVSSALNSVDSAASTISSTIKRLTDPDYLIGGVAAVVTTGFVMGAITSGISELGKLLFEFITESNDKRVRFEAFQKAMDKYKELQDHQPEFEKEIDRQLDFLNLVKEEAGSSEQLLYFARFNMLREKAMQKKLQAEIDKTLGEDVSPSAECLVPMFAEQAKVESRIAQLEAISKSLAEKDAVPEVCHKVDQQLRKLTEMESQMQRFHANLLNGIELWVKHWDKEFQKIVKDSDDYEKRLKAAKKLEEKGAKKSAKMLRTRLERDKALAYAECMSEQAPFWSSVPGLGYLFTSDERRMCKTMIDSPDSEIARKFHARAKDIREGIESREMDSAGKESIFSLLAKKAHAGDLRPGLTMDSMSYADQKRWIRQVAEDHSIENLGKTLKTRKARYQEYCAAKK